MGKRRRSDLYSMWGERRGVSGVSPPVPGLTGGLTPRRSPIALRILELGPTGRLSRERRRNS
jgi:hypothetical protein